MRRTDFKRAEQLALTLLRAEEPATRQALVAELTPYVTNLSRALSRVHGGESETLARMCMSALDEAIETFGRQALAADGIVPCEQRYQFGTFFSFLARRAVLKRQRTAQRARAQK